MSVSRLVHLPLLTLSTLALFVHQQVYAADTPDTSTQASVDDVIVVTGSRIEQQLKDVAGAVSVVERDTIERQVSTDIGDIFRYDPSITSTGASGSAQTLSVRGIGGNRVMYIKDGRRMNDAYEGGGGFLIGRGYLDVQQVQRVEVAKAAASPLYGSDGLGGIIVVTTPDPSDLLQQDDSYARVSAGYRSVNNEYFSALQTAWRHGDWQSMVALSYRNGDETQNYEETLPEYSFDAWSILAKTERAIAADQQLKFTVDHYQQDNQQILAAQTNETDVSDRQTALSVDYEAAISRAWADHISAQVYVSQYRQRSDQIVPGGSGAGAYTDFNDYRFDQDIWGARWQAVKSVNGTALSHQFVYGFDLDHLDTARPRFKTRVMADGTVSQDNQAQASFPGAETWLGGVFMQNNARLDATNTQFIAGLRADIYHMTPKDDDLYDQDQMSRIRETALSPKLGVVQAINDNTNVYLQYARGFRIPPHDQAYQSHGVEPFYVIQPNPGLNPETSDSFELGVKSFNGPLSYTVAAFYTDFTDFIDAQLIATEPTMIPGVNRSVFQFQNIESAYIYGAEMSAQYRFDSPWQLNAALIWTSGKDDSTDTYLTSISPWRGNLQLRYEALQWYAAAAVQAASSMRRVPDEDNATAAGWATFDLLAGYEWDNWQLNVSLQNLTDKRYVPYELVAGQSQATSVEQYSQPGRHAALRLSYQF